MPNPASADTLPMQARGPALMLQIRPPDLDRISIERHRAEYFWE
jgi:hypothetical protein